MLSSAASEASKKSLFFFPMCPAPEEFPIQMLFKSSSSDHDVLQNYDLYVLCVSWTPRRLKCHWIHPVRQVRRLISRVMISLYLSREVFNDRVVRVMRSKMKSSMFMVFCPLQIFARNDHELLQLQPDFRATGVPEYIISWLSTSLYFHTRHYHLLLLPKGVPFKTMAC